MIGNPPRRVCDTSARPLDARALLGSRVRVHLNLHNGCYVVGVGGRVQGYTHGVTLRDVTAKVSEAGWRRCRSEGTRNVHAWLEGTLADVAPTPPAAGRSWGALSYNCLTMPPCFYWRESGVCFTDAREVRCLPGAVVFASRGGLPRESNPREAGETRDAYMRRLERAAPLDPRALAELRHERERVYGRPRAPVEVLVLLPSGLRVWQRASMDSHATTPRGALRIAESLGYVALADPYYLPDRPTGTPGMVERLWAVEARLRANEPDQGLYVRWMIAARRYVYSQRSLNAERQLLAASRRIHAMWLYTPLGWVVHPLFVHQAARRVVQAELDARGD
jgi:hypothetical protein